MYNFNVFELNFIHYRNEIQIRFYARGFVTKILFFHIKILFLSKINYGY